MNGKITGEINSNKLEDNSFIHFYIATQEGRVYSSMNQLKADFGYDMQSLMIAISHIAGWLFAISINEAPNGFTLTGGVFNRSVDVIFPQTGHHAIIHEQYLGLDIFNVLGMKIDIRGTIPTIPSVSTLSMEDYQLELTRVSPGTLKSRVTIPFNFGPNTLDMSMIIDETIMFEECPHKSFDKEKLTTRLNIYRNHLEYDHENQATRYAFYESKISYLTDRNPCDQIDCGQYSACIVEGNDFRCVCEKGFQQLYSNTEQMNPKRITCIGMNFGFKFFRS